MSKMTIACEFSPQVRAVIKKRDGGKCIYCNRPVNHIHHTFVLRRFGLGVERNGVSLCTQHHAMIHSSSKMSAVIDKYCKDYLRNIYGDIDINELKYSKWANFKYKK
jgi:hypothetical protein